MEKERHILIVGLQRQVADHQVTLAAVQKEADQLQACPSIRTCFKNGCWLKLHAASALWLQAML